MFFFHSKMFAVNSVFPMSCWHPQHLYETFMTMSFVQWQLARLVEVEQYLLHGQLKEFYGQFSLIFEQPSL